MVFYSKEEAEPHRSALCLLQNKLGHLWHFLMGYSIFKVSARVCLYLFVLFGFMARWFWLSMVLPISPMVSDSPSRPWVSVTWCLAWILNSFIPGETSPCCSLFLFIRQWLRCRRAESHIQCPWVCSNADFREIEWGYEVYAVFSFMNFIGSEEYGLSCISSSVCG